MYRAPYFPTSPLHSYGVASSSWLQSAAGKDIIMPTGDVWAVVVDTAKSTSKLPVYTLVWMYDATGQYPQNGGVVTVSPDHPNYATFSEQLAKDGTIVSIEDGVSFAKAQRGQKQPSTKSRGSVAPAPFVAPEADPFWKNPWFIAACATTVIGVVGYALWPKGNAP